MRITAVFVVAACLSMASLTSHAALSISTVRSLAFGTFAAGAGGTISIDPDGMRSKTGGLTLFSLGQANPAAFLVSDDDRANAARAYSINLPADGHLVLNNGKASIAISDFTSFPAHHGRLTGGMQMLRVGATLQVPAGLPPGDYSGTFSVTVIYQ